MSLDGVGQLGEALRKISFLSIVDSGFSEKRAAPSGAH